MEMAAKSVRFWSQMIICIKAKFPTHEVKDEFPFASLAEHIGALVAKSLSAP